MTIEWKPIKKAIHEEFSDLPEGVFFVLSGELCLKIDHDSAFVLRNGDFEYKEMEPDDLCHSINVQIKTIA